jgi:hypothetical protein
MTLQEYQNTCLQLMKMTSLLDNLSTVEEKRKEAFKTQIHVLDLIERLALEPKDEFFDDKFASIRATLQGATLALSKVIV